MRSCENNHVCQIKEFQQEWRARVDRKKRPIEPKNSKDDPYNRSRQVTEHSKPTSALPSHKNPYQADTGKIRPISGSSRITPPKSQNNNISRSPTTKKGSHIKKRMPTTVTILPRPSTGRTPFKFNARFDMKRTKSLLSEDVQHLFGIMDIITYPGPVAMENTYGEPLHFMGEMTFKITIEKRTTTVSAWVMNDIPTGQLILGSGVLEALNLPLYNIPDILSHSGHAEDTDTIKDPRGCSPVTRASKLRVPSRDISCPQSYPPNAFLIPFKHGFHREIVLGAVGKKAIYYITPEGVRIKRKRT